MYNIPSPLLARVRLTVPVNGVYLPFHQASDIIRRYCTPAMFRNDDKLYDVSAVGSTVRLRHRGRNFVLFTKHQLGRGTAARPAEDFFLPLSGPDGRRVGSPPLAVSTLKMQHEAHANLEDIVLVEYGDSRAGRDFRPLFLKIDLAFVLGNVPTEQVKAIFAIGYPSAFGDADLAFDDSGMPVSYGIISRCVKLYLTPAEGAPLDTENRRPFVQDKRADQEIIEPDGMSGAPVFFVWLDDGMNSYLSFAGFITDARSNPAIWSTTRRWCDRCWTPTSISLEASRGAAGVAGAQAVCWRCFVDPALQDFVQACAERKKCDFCGRRGKSPIAARLDEVAAYIDERLRAHFDDPANGLAYESAEGGWMGNTFSSLELLEEEVGLELPNDDGTLIAAIADRLSNELWCAGEFYGLSPEDRLSFSWQRFCRTVKHERRFFFQNPEPGDDEVLDPGQTLERLFDYAQSAGLFKRLTTGTKLYRARYVPPGKVFQDAVDLGPPPLELAKQTNRMSPPGIVMMYASEDRDTALAETADKVADYVVGQFRTLRDATVLDLSDCPEIPSIFSEVPDSLEYDPRPRLIFLREVARDISRPIARDEKAHIEYVPTQVVTEYLRTVRTVDGRQIDGVRYRSARENAAASLVLFATQDNMVLPKARQPLFYALGSDRWIELSTAKSMEVTRSMLKRWKSKI